MFVYSLVKEKKILLDILFGSFARGFELAQLFNLDEIHEIRFNGFVRSAVFYSVQRLHFWLLS